MMVENRLLHADEIVCYTLTRLKGKSFLSVNDDEFYIDPVTKMLLISLTSVGGSLILIAVGVLAAYHFRFKIHSSWHIHPFDRDECEGEEIDYDTFLCCAQEDNRIALSLLKDLVSSDYRVCFHLRGSAFVIDELIEDNIWNSVIKSKRAVCLVSKNFLESQHCMREFHVALQINIELSKTWLIIMLLDNLLVHPNDPSMKRFLKRHTYLEYNSKDDKQKLRYALPVKKMGRVEEGYLADDNQATVGGVNQMPQSATEHLILAPDLKYNPNNCIRQTMVSMNRS